MMQFLLAFWVNILYIDGTRKGNAMFFSYDPDTGIKFHYESEEAEEAAQAALDAERVCAGDGEWSDNVTDICWGEVSQSVYCTNVTVSDKGNAEYSAMEFNLCDDRRTENLCKWTDAGESWSTSCGQVFFFDVGGPDQNEFQYCPFCGKMIQTEEKQ